MPREELYPFFSDHKNLEKITPPSLEFNILNSTHDRVQTGTKINYKLKVHGIPMKWSTLIKNVKKNEYFEDEQLKGPYSKWHHKHYFIKLNDNTTLIKDEIHYKIPLGSLGNLLLNSFISKDISKIFNYRQTIINKMFS
jgi:ligand-binding SRPBCC domain-containing protein